MHCNLPEGVTQVLQLGTLRVKLHPPPCCRHKSSTKWHRVVVNGPRQQQHTNNLTTKKTVLPVTEGPDLGTTMYTASLDGHTEQESPSGPPGDIQHLDANQQSSGDELIHVNNGNADDYEPEYVGIPKGQDQEDLEAEEYQNVDVRPVVQQSKPRLRQTALPHPYPSLPRGRGSQFWRPVRAALTLPTSNSEMYSKLLATTSASTLLY